MIGYFGCVGGPVCGFVCGKVVEVVGYYAIEEVFATYCNQSAAPLGVFGVVVSSSYESITQGVCYQSLLWRWSVWEGSIQLKW